MPSSCYSCVGVCLQASCRLKFCLSQNWWESSIEKIFFGIYYHYHCSNILKCMLLYAFLCNLRHCLRTQAKKIFIFKSVISINHLLFLVWECACNKLQAQILLSQNWWESSNWYNYIRCSILSCVSSNSSKKDCI